MSPCRELQARETSARAATKREDSISAAFSQGVAGGADPSMRPVRSRSAARDSLNLSSLMPRSEGQAEAAGRPMSTDTVLAVEAAVFQALVARGYDEPDAAVLARLLVPIVAREDRNKRIRAEFARGRTQLELAAAYDLDVRQVRRIVQGVHRTPPPADLTAAPLRRRYHCACGAIISTTEWERHDFRSCRDCMGL